MTFLLFQIEFNETGGGGVEGRKGVGVEICGLCEEFCGEGQASRSQQEEGHVNDYSS